MPEQHTVTVYSWQPFGCSAPMTLLNHEGKLTVEAVHAAVKRGKCKQGHKVVTIGVPFVGQASDTTSKRMEA